MAELEEMQAKLKEEEAQNRKEAEELKENRSTYNYSKSKCWRRWKTIWFCNK